MASDSQSAQVEQQEGGGVGALFGARWHGIWINDTERLRKCKFKLSWIKADKYHEKELKVRDNDLLDDWLYPDHKLTIEITHFVRSAKFYIKTLPGSQKDSTYAEEDLSITYSSDVISPTPYEYFFLCPWTLQGEDRWLNIYGTHLDLRLTTPFSDRGIDIDWKFPFSKWLGGYGEEEELTPRTIQKPLTVFTATLSIVKEYDWPEGFTVWLKTPSTDEVRINGEKEVDISLSSHPKLVIKKNGKPVAVIYTQDEGSWDLGVCWNVEQTRAGIVKHVYRPPYDDENNKHDLHVSPKWVTLYNYPHTYPRLGSNRGIAADISKELELWMGEKELIVGEGSSTEADVEEFKDVIVSEDSTSIKVPNQGEESSD